MAKVIKKLIKRGVMHCVYHKQWAFANNRLYPWKARCGTRTGSFRTIANIKEWAKNIADAENKLVTFEKIA